MSIPRQTPRLEFRILMHDEEGSDFEDFVSEWWPLEDPRLSIDFVARHFTETEHHGCCGMQGGYFIYANGERLNDGGSVDEFRMTETWFGTGMT